MFYGLRHDYHEILLVQSSNLLINNRIYGSIHSSPHLINLHQDLLTTPFFCFFFCEKLKKELSLWLTKIDYNKRHSLLNLLTTLSRNIYPISYCGSLHIQLSLINMIPPPQVASPNDLVQPYEYGDSATPFFFSFYETQKKRMIH